MTGALAEPTGGDVEADSVPLSPPPAARAPRWGFWAAVGLLLIAVLAAVAWRISGGRWMVIATPSMGQAAPVGTLVLTRPANVDEVTVGQIVTFREPGRTSETYTHRVVRVDADGGLHTKGDINGVEDSWAIHNADLIGVVVARWWGVGWLLRALPMLIVGWAVIWGVTRLYVSERFRTPLRVFGSSLLLAIAAFLLKPFVGFDLITSVADDAGNHETLVSTGLLPIRIASGPGGGTLDLIDGQVGSLIARPDGAHGVQLTSALHLSLGWWIAVVLIWLAPLLWVLIFGSPHVGKPPGPGDEGRGQGPGSEGGPGQPLEDGRAVSVAAGSGGPSSPVREPAPAAGGVVGRVSSSATLRPADTVRSPHPVARHRRGRRTLPRKARRVLIAVVASLAVLVGGATSSSASAFQASVNNSIDTAASATFFKCSYAAAGYTPYLVYPLNDTAVTSGSTAADIGGSSRTGAYGGGISRVASAACARDTTGYITMAGTGTTTYVSTPSSITGPANFTEAIWFKTSTGGGRLMGFGASKTGTSLNDDRQIYLSNTGSLFFGVKPITATTINSSSTYLDNNWHFVAATLSSATGLVLYVDGAVATSSSATKTAGSYTGYWRIGLDTLALWPSAPTNSVFTGALAYAYIYNSTLTAAQISTLYVAGH